MGKHRSNRQPLHALARALFLEEDYYYLHEQKSYRPLPVDKKSARWAEITEKVNRYRDRLMEAQAAEVAEKIVEPKRSAWWNDQD